MLGGDPLPCVDYYVGAALPFAAVSSKRLLILTAIDLVAFAALVALLHWSGYAGPQLALIPTLIVVVGAKFFGQKKDEDSAFGDHPDCADLVRTRPIGRRPGATTRPIRAPLGNHPIGVMPQTCLWAILQD